MDAGSFTPVSDDQPAGENLELDPEFGELERAAQGKPEVQYGATVEPAVPPDWKQTAQIAESLSTRTHDLRVMVHLATAKLHLAGLPGFAAVVAAIRHEVSENWPHVHPQLDPDDDNDPMQRANALLQLRQPLEVMRTLRDMPLASTPRTGPVAWRDIAVVNGALEPEPDRPKLTEAVILGAFTDGDRARIQAAREALEQLLVDIPGISSAFDAHSGVGQAPDYTPLSKLLSDMHRDLVHYQSASEGAGGSAADAPGDEPSAATGPGGSGGPAAAGRGFASIQAINSLSRREDALHALELAASYFRTQEPSSPLPLLIERAKRLAGMAFMDILRDLAPDGLSQAQLVAGATSE